MGDGRKFPLLTLKRYLDCPFLLRNKGKEGKGKMSAWGITGVATSSPQGQKMRRRKEKTCPIGQIQ